MTKSKDIRRDAAGRFKAPKAGKKKSPHGTRSSRRLARYKRLRDDEGDHEYRG